MSEARRQTSHPTAAVVDAAAQLERLAALSMDVLYRVRFSPQPRLVYVSQAALAITGYRAEELLADPGLWQRLVHPDDRSLIPDPQTVASQPLDVVARPVVLRWIRRDGAIRWTEHRSVPVRDEQGRLVALEGIARDVTQRVTAEARDRSADARLRDLLSTIDLGALVLDATGRVEFINDYLLGLLGRRREELQGNDWIDIAVPKAERPAVRAAFQRAIAAGTGAGQREDGIVTRDGRQRRLLWTSAIQVDDAGAVIGLAAIAHDVTDVRLVQAERARLATAIEQSAESVMITDADGRIEYVNAAFERLSGYASAEVVGRNPRLLKSGLQSATFYDAMWAALTAGLPWSAELINRRKDGALYHLAAVISPIRGADGSITGYVNVGRDVSRERELESQAEALLRERALIAETLRRLPPGRDPETTAELFCRQVASMTDITVASLIVFEGDAVAIPLAYVAAGSDEVRRDRLGPTRSRYLRDRAASGPWVEEWTDDGTHPYAASFRQAGVRAFAYAPVRGEDGPFGVLAIGTIHPDAVNHATSHLGALVDFAELAGALLAPDVVDRREAMRLRRTIELVIAQRSFTSVYQPIVDMQRGRIVGYEALTRFADGVAPDARFADADRVGLGANLELVTLQSAVAAASRLGPYRWLHLNVSPALIATEPALASVLLGASRRIVIEVTEQTMVMVSDYRALRAAMAGFGQRTQLAVDDAGAGFASLRHILELSPRFVQLDISLTRGIDADPAKQALVAGLLYFARTTNCLIIAEGVETDDEAATLRELGVRLAQGYLFGRPAPPPG